MHAKGACVHWCTYYGFVDFNETLDMFKGQELSDSVIIL